MTHERLIELLDDLVELMEDLIEDGADGDAGLVGEAIAAIEELSTQRTEK